MQTLEAVGQVESSILDRGAKAGEIECLDDQLMEERWTEPFVLAL